MTQLPKNKDGTVKIPITIPKTQIQKAHQQALLQAAKNVEIKGFRKGKAPLDKVENALDQSKLYQQVLQNLIPQVLAKALKEHKLKPIAKPRLIPQSMEKDRDWQFTLEIIEFPSFSLGKYKDHIKAALQATKIWLPGQDNKVGKKDDTQSLTDKRLKKIFDVLLDNIQVPLAKTLIEDEVNRNLSRLLAQVQKLGLTIDQYLSSINKTSKSIREDYKKTAQNNLKLEFILQKISQDLNIKVEDIEFQKLINSLPDEKTKTEYQKPEQKAYLTQVLKKRKTIDALLKLA